MNSRSITDYILKLEKENFDLKKDLLESEIQRVSTTLNEADESRTKIEHLKKLFKEANEEKVNALNELNDLKYKNRSYTETTARVLHKSVNQGLIDRLLELGEMTSDIYKTMTYQKAADTITNLSYEVKSGESLLDISGIGKGIAAKVNEYLEEQDSDYEESECSESESIASNGDESESIASTEEAFFVSEDVINFSDDEESDDEESDGEEFFASFNADLCDMLHNLADKTDDKFKCKAYCRAANSVYELPYKITSGKAISQGPNKVPGVGKSIAKKIDEYLKKPTSTNEEIAEMLYCLADDSYDAKFKHNAYVRAAYEIKKLPFEVTSGEELSKGPNKVVGVGKSIANKIDQFLQTGKVN